jgi:uncharacterized protein
LEDKIRLLYILQILDYKLMELEEEKGDLPGIVKRLDSQLHELHSRIELLQSSIDSHFNGREQSTLEAESLNERVETLKKQLYEVRNNKEYDAITREINEAEAHITSKLERSEEHEMLMNKLQTELEDLQQKAVSLESELGENKNELQSVSKTHENEELHLKHERDKIARQLSRDDLVMYDRIRNAKDGKAVVPIRRGACGGCYKTVPPQLNLLLRKNDEIHICENCGRILVAEEIAAEAGKVA